MTGAPKTIVLLVIMAATIGCDRVTKHLAATSLADGPRWSMWSDTVRLEYVENTGAFLGLGADWPEPVRVGVFLIGNALLLLGLVIVAMRGRWRPAALAGFALFAAGGASNLADRIVRGSVIDFMNVGVGSLRTGIFNVADMAILLGACLVAFAGHSAPQETPPRQDAAPGDRGR